MKRRVKAKARATQPTTAPDPAPLAADAWESRGVHLEHPTGRALVDVEVSDAHPGYATIALTSTSIVGPDRSTSIRFTVTNAGALAEIGALLVAAQQSADARGMLNGLAAPRRVAP